MKRSLFLLPVLLLASCGMRGDAPSDEKLEKAVVSPPTSAQIAPEVGAFAMELKQALLAAMGEGGLNKAISVCREKAPELAEAHSTRTGWTIRRSALRLRNPQNAPDAWERQVLEDFEKRLAGGEDPTTMTAYEVSDGRARFAKAIPTGDACLMCHGSAISSDVRETLAKLYPDDKATGFVAGQLRGIFSVSAPAEVE